MKQQSRSPTMAEVIRLAIKQAMAELHVSLPGSIHTYDASQQKADVRLLLMRPLVANDGTELDSESLPLLMDVPIVFPRGGRGGGEAFISWPLEQGDLVHVHFTDWSIDQWLDKRGEVTDPLDYRAHSLSDAVAYPGLYPRKLSLADAHAENLVIGWDGGVSIHVKPGGEVHLGSENAAQFVALAQKTFDEIDALRSTVNSLITAYNVHIHTTTATIGPSAVPGVISSTTSQASPPSPVQSVAAEKVKAD